MIRCRREIFLFFSANLSDRKASIEGDMMATEEKGRDDNTLKFAFSKSHRKNNKKEKKTRNMLEREPCRGRKS